MAGTIAGAAIPVIMLAAAIVGSFSGWNDLASMAGIAPLAIFVPFVFVIASSLVVGVPATLIMKRFGWESEDAYAYTGAIAGFLMPVIILVIVERSIDIFWNALPAGILGLLSGVVTGRTWWRARRSAAAGVDRGADGVIPPRNGEGDRARKGVVEGQAP